MKSLGKKIILFLICISVFQISLAKDDIQDLRPWVGKFKTMSELYNQAGEKGYWREVKKYKKNYTEKEIKKFITGMFSQKFKKIEVKDRETIIFDDKTEAKYYFVGKFSTKWREYDLSWYIFRTDNLEAIKEGYKNILLVPIHSHGQGTISHWHLRYGNQNIDYLITDPSIQSWWPTCYSPKEAKEKNSIEKIFEGAKMMASVLPDK
jgi:hypothetical protein